MSLNSKFDVSYNISEVDKVGSTQKTQKNNTYTTID